MISLKDLRKKIQGIKSTQQITNAMKLMASVKLRRIVSEYLSIYIYHDKLEQIILHLKRFMQNHTYSHQLYNKKKEINTIGYVIFSAERGLCGSFNSEFLRYAENILNNNTFKQNNSKNNNSTSNYIYDKNKSSKLIIIGKKGIEYFSKKNFEILASYSLPTLHDKDKIISDISKLVTDLYKNDVFDDVRLIYSEFASTIERKYVHKILLPVEEIPENRAIHVKLLKIQFEPNFEEVLNNIINAYIFSSIQRAMIETSASEMAARMVAMDSATDRAEEMLENLTLILNRTRQALITKELIEITSTANALSS